MAKLMVVEDERIVAADLQGRLERLGYEVIGNVGSGEEALEILGVLEPDLILMDIHLAGALDGIETTRRIHTRHKVPVVFLTAHSDDKTLQQAIETGPGGYIVKPFHDKDLRSTIEVVLFKHQMERKLKEREEWLSTTLNSVGDAVIATDSDGMIQLMNPVAEELTKWSRQEAIGRRVLDIVQLIDEVTQRPIECPVQRAVVSGEIIKLEANTILCDKEGNRITIDDSAAPIRDADNRVAGAILVFKDVTQRKELEERLRQSHKLEAIGRLAGGVAHDFNNIMTAILGLSDLLLSGIDSGHPMYESLNEIRSAGERATQLTHQLLAFSRKQLLAPIVLNLNDQLREMQRMVRRLIEEHIEVVYSLATDLCNVRVDPVQLQQIIINLVVNARDAMPGGGRLTITTANVELDDHYVKERPQLKAGKHVLLAVSDTGTGMDRQTKERLFEPFFTTKEQGKGTGLGLATVYGIVSQSGGHIEVYSEIGFGTQFKVYLPIVEATSAPQRPPIDVGGLRGNETILVVEDEPMVRALLCKILSGSGYKVLEAEDGLKGLAILEEESNRIDLLISDVIMPQLNGRELAERALQRRPELKVVFMSGYTDNLLSNSGMLTSQVKFLQKPFVTSNLLKMVRSILDSRQSSPC